MNILVGYASAHGSTEEIARFMGRLLEAYDVKVTLSQLEDVQDVSSYDAFIVGSPIHAGMWLQAVSLFFERCGAQMAGKPAFLFITCIRVMEDDGREHALQYYVHHPTLEAVGITNDRIGVLAGKIDINAINWDERWLLSSNYDGTEGSKLVNHDYRDWQAIAGWTHGVAKMMGVKPALTS
jgi:menaquinone-dependent protoporphyrinogen oxidase